MSKLSVYWGLVKFNNNLEGSKARLKEQVVGSLVNDRKIFSIYVGLVVIHACGSNYSQLLTS
ncbi:hypothetical protein NIES593_22835 [Hydrococcus rivularis NIES-593]|uniref:Uncharacterized protein n=1 Tax=Hydrococcus rivularis NIES-593 TaxID=1921803 RepID=A0A1U7H738_9CYAN|nr:hypothetical protein NIES593_22835 [Hydrococcus rivularis NIES-593]